MIKTSMEQGLLISSISDPAAPQEWSEVEADGIYLLNFKSLLMTDPKSFCAVTRIPWTTTRPYHKAEVESSLVLTTSQDVPQISLEADYS